MLLPVSSSLIYTYNTFYDDKRYYKQGFKYFFPSLKTKYSVINNGLDVNFWKKNKQIIKEEKTLMTVFSEKQYILKGGDLIVNVSEKFRDYQFLIAGTEKPSILKKIPENVKFLGKLKPEELRDLYNRSRYYLQLSAFEGFGYALCEAMLCECIPIGSSVNIIPDIIGNTGYILYNRDVNELEEVLSRAFTENDKVYKGKKARERIVEKFNEETRKEKLFKLIEKQKI